MLQSTTLYALSYQDYLAVFAAAFLASIIGGIGGFGGGILVALVLSPIVGVKAVVPLIAVFAFVANIGRIGFYFRTIDWRLASQFFLASLPGLFIGTTFFKWVPERLLVFIFGLVLIAAIPVRRYLKSHEFKPSWKTIVFFGFFYGCVSGTAVGPGMFVIAGLLSMGLQGTLLLGTDAVIGLMNSFARMAAFRYHGLLSNDLIKAGLLIGLATAPGTWLASKLVKRTDQNTHAILVEIIIICGGAMMLVEAIR